MNMDPNSDSLENLKRRQEEAARKQVIAAKLEGNEADATQRKLLDAQSQGLLAVEKLRKTLETATVQIPMDVDTKIENGFNKVQALIDTKLAEQGSSLQGTITAEVEATRKAIIKGCGIVIAVIVAGVVVLLLRG